MAVAFPLDDILRPFLGDLLVLEPGWQTNERPGVFTPVGSMVHHTAGGRRGDAPTLDLCKDGSSRGIPGPLCNGLIARSGRVHVITDGKASDSGKGSGRILHEVRNEITPVNLDAAKRGLLDNTDGNPWFFDWEIENAGTGDDRYPDAQYRSTVLVQVALCLHFGWSWRRVIAHREWTRRKPDPRGIDMAAFRRDVANTLDFLAAGPTTVLEDDMQRSEIIVTVGAPDEHGRQLVSRDHLGNPLPATFPDTHSVDVLCNSNGLPFRGQCQWNRYGDALVLSFFREDRKPVEPGNVALVIEHR